MVGGFDVDAEPGFLESNAVGIIFQVQHYFSKHTHSEQNAHFAHCIQEPMSNRLPAVSKLLFDAGWLCGVCVCWSCSHIAVGTTSY